MGKVAKDRPGWSPLQAIQYSEQLSSVDLWLTKAEELLASAVLLETEVRTYWSETEFRNGQVVNVPNRKNVQGVYCMLIAYVIENYCKALLVLQNRKRLQNKLLRRLPGYLKTHDLVGLARRIGMRLSIPDEELLSRLTRNSEWSARYPIPTGPSAIAASQELSDGRQYFVAYLGPRDMNFIGQFLNRLVEYVDQRIGA